VAQIFVSHSAKDSDAIDFFLRAFAGTKVKPHFEEFEKEVPTGVTADKIERDIQASNAVFVLLSETVENLPHTRDWINWECGVAVQKEIWVFEPLGSLGKIRVVVPRFNHYAVFSRDEEWRTYLRSAIDSYDDSHVLPTLAATTGGGALLGEGVGAGIGLGVGLIALILQNKSKPPLGVQIACCRCGGNYRVHRYGRFRCAVCNAWLLLPEPPSAGGP
jgi:hypothetical protein